MSPQRPDSLPAASPRPWYREPWPWVLIAIPAIAVIAGLTTLWLALSNPDYTVVDDSEYRQIRNEFRAQPAEEPSPDGEPANGG